MAMTDIKNPFIRFTHFYNLKNIIAPEQREVLTILRNNPSTDLQCLDQCPMIFRHVWYQ